MDVGSIQAMNSLTYVASQTIQPRYVNTILCKSRLEYMIVVFGGMKQGMIPVYIETLMMTNDDEGFEQLANIINFLVTGGIL